MEQVMTCIVGFSTKGKVYIGGDSAGLSGWTLTVHKDPKVFTNGPCIMGGCGSFRVRDLLRYALVVPERHPDEDIDKWMRTIFVDAIRGCLKTGGVAEKDKEVEKTGDSWILVGYEGRLFKVQSDYQISEALDPYDATGCGEEYAKGAMAAMIRAGDIAPEDMIRIALEITERNCAGVRAPFNVVTL
jgi:ATP-dependent protease HslVU (ClpYQ) peptidase subunit